MEAICFASDVAVLTSDNEGTPVSLIEAHAAGLPAVSTGVGGVGQVVEDGASGHVIPPDADRRFADAVTALLADPGRAAAMGERGRDRVVGRYSLDRLTADVDRLYTDLLRHRGRPLPEPAP
jgi:glycosyltransferase involved in cell wall biosynthesis